MDTDYLGTEIAIIGMAGRFPGARNVDTFWQNLRDGVWSVRVLDEQERQKFGSDETSQNDPNFVTMAAVLDDMDCFDASFFGYTPREAELMDPQHRVFLECAWEALEAAGYSNDCFEEVVGVFAGGTTNTYLLINLRSHPHMLNAIDPVQIDLSNGADFLATRVSYKLNLTGPSYTIQSACSTSLTAVHVACQSLLNEECDMALAGGVSVNVQHPLGYRYMEGGIVSPDGRIRAFDEQANGFVFGSGVGIVVLKRLADALADGDHIRAIIKGSAINNDGNMKVGYTAPSVEGQAEVITEALAVAGLSAADISYVEAHGTATRMGDPIEVRALTKAFRDSTSNKSYCALGSVKTNIGHLAGAAGVTGLIKTVLALENKQIPPSLHFEQPNPALDLPNSPFFVNTKLRDWPANGRPRYAGVSSFGLGGTNVHMVLAEAPARSKAKPAESSQLLLLSAKTETALERLTDNLTDHLQRYPDINLANVAYTLQTGRRAFAYRRAAVCHNAEDAIHILGARDAKRVQTLFNESEGAVAFMFPGVGDQYLGMGRGLYNAEPVFRTHIDQCAEILQPYLDQDLRDLLYADSVASPATMTNEPSINLTRLFQRTQVNAVDTPPILRQPGLTYPALFATEYALAQLLMAWGVKPQAMIGYSVGEYVAACLAGVFSLEDALIFITRRGQLVETLPTGAMLAVMLPEEEVQPFLSNNISVAAVDGPLTCVLTGTEQKIAELENSLIQQAIACRRVQTVFAFHSPLIEPILPPLTELLSKLKLNPPQIPYISNFSGTWISDEQATDPNYWAKHMRHTVRFADGIGVLWEGNGRILVEIGPGNALSALAVMHSGSGGATERVITTMRRSYEQQQDLTYLDQAVGKLWASGVNIDWQQYNKTRGQQRTRVPLPTYAFERQRYWINEATETPATLLQKNTEVADWFYTPTWKTTPLPPPAQRHYWADAAGKWLIFVDETGLGQQIAATLQDAGQEIITVKPGNKFVHLDDDKYYINPDSPEDYRALIAAVGKPLRHFLHLWSLTPEHGAGQIEFTNFDRIQSYGFYSLLYLVQSLSELDLTEVDDLRLWVMTNNVYQIESGDVVNPAKATVLGTCLTIPHEFPFITCHCLDISLPSADEQNKNEHVYTLLAEIQENSSEPVIAYRGCKRWGRNIEQTYLSERTRPLRRLRTDGVYLVTGALLSPELNAVKFLAEHVSANFAFVGEMPQEGLPLLDNLEKLGANAVHFQANVIDAQQMQAAVAEVVSRFGLIDGVIYAVEVANAQFLQPISACSAETCNSYFTMVVRSLNVLQEILKEFTPDFCLLSSSLSAILGSRGLVAATAVAHFLSQFACRQSMISSYPWISLNWDTYTLDKISFPTDLPQLSDGAHAISRLLNASTANQINVSIVDLDAQVTQANAIGAQPEGMGLYEGPALQTTYAEPRNEYEQKVANIWQQILGIRKIGINDNFFELGGHSLLATQLHHHLYDVFQVEISIQRLFENATIAEMATLVQENAQTVNKQASQPIAVRLLNAFPTDRLKICQAYLEPNIAQCLNTAVSSLPQNGDLSQFDLELLSVDLILQLKQDLGIQFYPHEITSHPIISDLAGYIVAEFERMQNLSILATDRALSTYTLRPYKKQMGRTSIPTGNKNKRMVFLHSSPRAGSTLLRVMLAGHPDLFCPPELNVLFFENMQEWAGNIGFGHDFQWTAQGMHWAFVELQNMASNEGWRLLNDFVEQNISVPDVYQQLIELASPSLLVDKTPTYSLDMETLWRAEKLFEEPKYIYLYRHPYAVIESLLRVRLDKLFGPSLFAEKDVDPYAVGEAVWSICNSNLLQFFEKINPTRCIFVRYEELVSNPVGIMNDICRFLEIPYNESLLLPYDGRRERMMGGLGDPNIFQHTRIDPQLAELWRTIQLPRRLADETKQVALKLGYELPHDKEIPLSQEHKLEEQLLARLDTLSDKDVADMLSQLLVDEQPDLGRFNDLLEEK